MGEHPLFIEALVPMVRATAFRTLSRPFHILYLGIRPMLFFLDETGRGSRTLEASLEGWSVTTTPYPQNSHKREFFLLSTGPTSTAQDNILCSNNVVPHLAKSNSPLAIESQKKPNETNPGELFNFSTPNKGLTL